MSKLRVLAALLVAVGTLKVGAMQGAVEQKNDSASYAYSYGSALVNQSPVSSSKSSWLTKIKVTGYSSRIEETDETPFITASGTTVRPGVIAANWLPFGTKVRIPDVFGNRVFVVEDRMHRRNSDKMDIWFPTTEEALRFGVQSTRVEIL